MGRGRENRPPSVEETALAVDALLDDPESEPDVSRAQSNGWCGRVGEAGRGRSPAPIGFYFAKLWYFEEALSDHLCRRQHYSTPCHRTAGPDLRPAGPLNHRACLRRSRNPTGMVRITRRRRTPLRRRARASTLCGSHRQEESALDMSAPARGLPADPTVIAAGERAAELRAVGRRASATGTTPAPTKRTGLAAAREPSRRRFPETLEPGIRSRRTATAIVASDRPQRRRLTKDELETPSGPEASTRAAALPKSTSAS